MCKAIQLSMWHGWNFNPLGRKEKEDKRNQDWDCARCLVREWWVMEWWVGHRRCCCEVWREVREQLHVVSLDSDSAWLLPSSFHLFLCPSFFLSSTSFPPWMCVERLPCVRIEVNTQWFIRQSYAACPQWAHNLMGLNNIYRTAHSEHRGGTDM